MGNVCSGPSAAEAAQPNVATVEKDFTGLKSAKQVDATAPATSNSDFSTPVKAQPKKNVPDIENTPEVSIAYLFVQWCIVVLHPSTGGIIFLVLTCPN